MVYGCLPKYTHIWLTWTNKLLSKALDMWTVLCVTLMIWYMVRFHFRSGHQKYMYYNETRLCAQDVSIILNSIINTMWRAYFKRK